VPNSESAKKRVRQNAKRQSLNKWRKRRIKDATRSFTEALQAQDVNKAEDAFRTTCGLLDGIACTSTIHRNTAARRKSRLARRLNALKQAKA